MLDVVDRFPLYPLILVFVLYPLVAWILLKVSPARSRLPCFALLNVAGLGLLCWLTGAVGVRVKQALAYSRIPLLFFSIYIAFVLGNYVFLRLCRRSGAMWSTLAFLFPLRLPHLH